MRAFGVKVKQGRRTRGNGYRKATAKASKQAASCPSLDAEKKTYVGRK